MVVLVSANRYEEVDLPANLRYCWLLSCCFIIFAVFPGDILAQTSPEPPIINEPAAGRIVNPFDAHLETAPISDPKGDEHDCTDSGYGLSCRSPFGFPIV